MKFYYKERLKDLVDAEVKITGEPRLAVANRLARQKLATESQDVRDHIRKVLDEEKKGRDAAEEAAVKVLDGTMELKPKDYAE